MTACDECGTYVAAKTSNCGRERCPINSDYPEPPKPPSSLRPCEKSPVPQKLPSRRSTRGSTEPASSRSVRGGGEGARLDPAPSVGSYSSNAISPPSGWISAGGAAHFGLDLRSRPLAQSVHRRQYAFFRSHGAQHPILDHSRQRLDDQHRLAGIYCSHHIRSTQAAAGDQNALDNVECVAVAQAMS